MVGPPTGTVTFLFTDIEGSTRMWERSPEAMAEALVRHDEILQRVIEAHGGHVFKTVGDAFCCAFPTAPMALEATLDAQRTLFAQDWGEIGALRVRMALHTGVAEERDGDYFGPPVNRVARLLSAGHGGQVLLSVATQELVGHELPAAANLRDLGERRLKDLFRPERVFQLLATDLPSSFPPLKTLDARLNNLPTQPTVLIGREKELTEIAGHLRRPGIRLVTLTGPGGTGKTRLGLQAAADLLDEFEDGVFFVALAPISDADIVASAIASPLGVRASPEQPLMEALKAFLEGKELLILLDNFEQVIGAAPLVGELLAACPGLKVLTTSRAALRVYGEFEYPVPPLALPDPKRIPSLAALTHYEAVNLFIERARAVKANFAVTDESAPAVAEICVRLDGLPLAIELAAARVRILSPGAMLERLANRLKLLKGGARDLPARQQTLRGTIGWSHELLNEEERTLFRRLSVFAGGFALEAAEEVCEAVDAPEVDVLDGAESLLAKSLLRRDESSGEGRLFMLETIREYAMERLGESAEAEEIGRAHAEYFLAMAGESGLRPWASAPAREFGRLEREQDNFRAALSWALEGGKAEVGLRLACALYLFWSTRGQYDEGRRWLEAALAEGHSATPSVRAEALCGLATFADDQGDHEKAMCLYGESLALYRALGDRPGVAFCLSQMGWATAYRGELERAETLFEEALEVQWELRNKQGSAHALDGLGTIALSRGDQRRATAQLEEALALKRETGTQGGIVVSLGNLSYAAVLNGDHARARDLAEEGVAMSRALGQVPTLAQNLMNLGHAARGLADYERARSSYEEALNICQEMGQKLGIMEALLGMAGVASAVQEDARAARLWGAAEELREATGLNVGPADRALHEPYLQPVRSRLGEAAWREALAEGREATLGNAVAYALGQAGGVTTRGASRG